MIGDVILEKADPVAVVVDVIYFITLIDRQFTLTAYWGDVKLLNGD